MRYNFRHLTRFNYHNSVRESVMELRMHPVTDELQRCLSLFIELSPTAVVFRYDDHAGNVVHHFDIPEEHRALSIDVTGQVEVLPLVVLPARLEPSAWADLDTQVADGDFYEMLSAGQVAHSSPEVEAYAASIDCRRRDDPFTVLLDVTRRLHTDFAYVPSSTRVDSPIEDALRTRRGVCQDFAHLMVVLARDLGIPARYVSGYLYSSDASAAAQASHAWVQAWLPGLGWTGFDPTNGGVVDERYIRTAVGRDYGDVPPTRGVFKGEAAADMEVGVWVQPSDLVQAGQDLAIVVPDSAAAGVGTGPTRSGSGQQ